MNLILELPKVSFCNGNNRDSDVGEMIFQWKKLIVFVEDEEGKAFKQKYRNMKTLKKNKNKNLKINECG